MRRHNVIFSRLIDWDSHGNLVPGLARLDGESG